MAKANGFCLNIDCHALIYRCAPYIKFSRFNRLLDGKIAILMYAPFMAEARISGYYPEPN